MNILFCHERFLFRFGVDRVLILLGKALKELGHDVSVMGNRFDRKIVRTFSSQVIEVPSRQEYPHQDEFTRDWLERTWSRHFDASTPDLVVVAGWPFFSAIPFFRQAGCKVIFSDYGLVPLQGYTGMQRITLEKIKALRQSYLSQCSAIIGCSEFIVNSQSVPDSFGRVKTYSILLGADHLDMRIWSADKLKTKKSEGHALRILHSLKNEERPVLLSLGRWEPDCYKNSEAAFDVMARIRGFFPDCALLILADPLDTRIPSEFKNILFPVGFPDDSEMAELMKTVDLGLCFSLWEGFNLPLAEIQRQGRPALCFDLGAHPEVVFHPWYLCRDNAEMVSKAYAVLSGGGPDVKTKTEALKRFHRDFSWKKVVQEYVRVFEEVLEESETMKFDNKKNRFLVVVDVTNSTKDPANSGVIRVTRRLCRELQRHEDPVFAVWDQAQDRYVLPTELEFQQLSRFNGPVLPERSHLSPNSQRIPLEDLLRRLGGQSRWLVFSETLNGAHARAARRFARDFSFHLAAIFYDAIAVIHPEFVNDEIKRNHSTYMAALAECDVVIPISDFSACCLEDFWKSRRIQKCRVIPNLLPGEFGGSERARKVADLLSGEINLLCVSTLEPRKNHLRLLQACLLMQEKNPELSWSLTFVGNLYQGRGDIAESIKAFAGKNPKIKWLGVVDDLRLQRLYRNATFTVYPSVVEGFGMPILESIWHGRPCICSDRGVMAELAAEGGCLTTNVSDEKALSEAIYRLATDKDLLMKLCQEAVKRKMRTWNDYVLDFLGILTKCTNGDHLTKREPKTPNNPSWEEILYPGCLCDHWQMSDSEKLGLTSVLYRRRPRCSIEVGTYLGGSLSLTAQHSEFVFSIDIDPTLPKRFERYQNVSFLTGPSSVVLPLLFRALDEASIPVDFILLDGDHSGEGIKRDLSAVLSYVPKSPLLVLIHDTFNPECRRGVLESAWEKSAFVHWVDVDFVPGRIIEHGGSGDGEMWGGFGLAYMQPEENGEGLTVRASAQEMFRALSRSLGRSL